MPPAALEGERARRIPRYADRGRIQRSGFDVPAALIRLAAVEAACLDLDSVEDESGGQDAEADVGRIEPMVADRRFG